MKAKLFFVLLVAALVVYVSCKKDKDNDPDICATNWGVATQKESTAVANAAMAYITNQSVANCNAYKTALQAHVNALKKFENCASLTGLSKAELKADIDEYQETVNDLTCQ
jgi:hypothetical protein